MPANCTVRDLHADPQCSEDIKADTPMTMLHNTVLKRQRTLELYLVISSDALHVCVQVTFTLKISRS